MSETDEDDLRDTVKPKSDQLNADDLLTGPIDVTVLGVARGTPDQPVNIVIDGRMPYKPCKSMRRVLISIWGFRGSGWVGKSMRLFCDPDVKFGGVALGGIRISHMSDIDAPVSLMLTSTRSKRKLYTVQPMESYPQELFEKNLDKWCELIMSGKMTNQQVIDKAAERCPLSAEQRAAVMAIQAVASEG